MYLTARANSLLYQAQVFAVRRAQFAVRRSPGIAHSSGFQFGVRGPLWVASYGAHHHPEPKT